MKEIVAIIIQQLIKMFTVQTTMPPLTAHWPKHVSTYVNANMCALNFLPVASNVPDRRAKFHPTDDQQKLNTTANFKFSDLKSQKDDLYVVAQVSNLSVGQKHAMAGDQAGIATCI